MSALRQHSENNATRICSNTERLRHLSSMCDTTSDDETGWNGRGRFLIDDKHKLFYCSVSKAGCTQFKAIMETANTGDTKYLTQLHMVHTSTAMRAADIRLRTTYDSRFRDYTKVLLVRNPFDRALSAYRNLLVGMQNYGPGHNVYEHLQLLYPNSTTGGNKCDKLELSDYVQFITSPELSPESVYNDRHFKSIALSCGLCQIEYDYFLRLETFSTDIIPILEHLGLPPDFLDSIPAVNKAKAAPSSQENVDDSVTSFSNQLPEFKNVSLYNMDLIASRYRFDMDFLGYHMHNDNQVASCSLRAENGEICC